MRQIMGTGACTQSAYSRSVQVRSKSPLHSTRTWTEYEDEYNAPMILTLGEWHSVCVCVVWDPSSRSFLAARAAIIFADGVTPHL